VRQPRPRDPFSQGLRGVARLAERTLVERVVPDPPREIFDVDRSGTPAGAVAPLGVATPASAFKAKPEIEQAIHEPTIGR
jgi:hypothetical protein